MRQGIQRAKALVPVGVKRVIKDPLRAVAPKKTAYRRLRSSVPSVPRTFTEKIRYRMAFDRRPILRTFADKVAVRAYAADRVGEEALPSLFGVFEKATSITWDELPREFVLKASHGSGAVAVVWEGARAGRQPTPAQRGSWAWRGTIHPDSLDIRQMERLAAEWLGLSYELSGPYPEWAYGDLPRRIIAEELLQTESGALPNDYKFFMFDGNCVAIQVHVDRFGSHAGLWLSPDWIPFQARSRDWQRLAALTPPPSNLPVMLELAELLSDGLDFIRVDLYDLGTRVVFGELTNYPNAGRDTIDPVDFDRFLGSHWRLSQQDH